MLNKLILLGVAGALGTVLRYGCAVYVERAVGGIFPWHTFVVNVVGCFFFGLCFAVMVEKMGWDGDARVFVLTGFFGAFTTFSTFAFETSALMRESQYVLAMANLAAHNVLGILFLLLGLLLGRLF